MNIESSVLAVLTSVIVGISAATIFYFKDKKIKEAAQGIRIILFMCRFFIVSILIFFLFAPLSVSKKETIQDPIFPVLIDNSRSISLMDSAFSNEFSLFENQLKKTLNGVDIKMLPFSSRINIGDSLTFNRQGTNLSATLNGLDDLFPSSNIGGALLISDGILTQGEMNIPTKEYPFYTIGVGDSSSFPDAKVKKAFHNDVVYLKNEFSVESVLSFEACEGQPQLIQLKFQGDVVDERTYTPTKMKDFFKFKSLISAKEKGVYPLEVTVSNTQKEQSIDNNKLIHFIKVKEKKQKILMVYDFPHPDVRLTKTALFGLSHLEVVSTNFTDRLKDCAEYNAVIMIGNATKNEDVKYWLEKIKTSKTGFIWVTGSKGSFNNEFVKFVRLDNSNDDVGLWLPNQFSLFKRTDGIKTLLEGNQRVNMPFGKWVIQGESTSLAKQTINGVQTDYDAIAFSHHQGVSFCMFLGEGYWRYGLRGEKIMSSLLHKAIDFVSVHIDNSKLKINGFDEFLQGEDVSFEAIYRNQSNELDNSGELKSILIRNDSIVEQSNFLKTDSAYRINFGLLIPGVYKVKVEIEKGGQQLKREKRFIVKEIKVESEHLSSNFERLRLISDKGTFNLWKDRDQTLSDLLESNRFKSITYVESITDLLLKHSWMLYFLIGLISIEWLIRKWQGTI